MDTLMIINDETADTKFFCPLCKSSTSVDDIETDDYIKLNILYWCRNCGEVLVCMTRDDFINIIERNPITNKCIVSLTEDEAKKYGYIFELKKGDKYYKTHILRITHIKCSSEESDNEEHQNISHNYHHVSGYSFHELQKYNVDTSHDGIYLYYKGVCEGCNKEYESYIWGD